LTPKLRDDAALKLELEVVAAAPAGVPVLVPVPAGVMEEAGAVVVTPKLEAVAGVAIEIEVDEDLAPELKPLDVELVELVVEVVLTSAPMEKEPVVDKTSPILPIATASRVYPPPAGMMGNSMVADPAEGTRLLPIANESWKAVLKSSSVKLDGSVGSAVQVIVH